MDPAQRDRVLADARAWLVNLKDEWRERYRRASAEERASATRSLLSLAEPVRIHAFVRVAGAVAVPVTVLRVSPAPADAVAVTVLGDSGLEGGDGVPDPTMLEVAERLHEDAARGWTPGRVVTPHRAGAHRIDDGSVYEVVGDLSTALTAEIVRDCFRVDTPGRPPDVDADPRHAFDLPEREPELVRRLLSSPFRLQRLLLQLGLRSACADVRGEQIVAGAWVGLFLPRRAVFGGQHDGDIDLLAGVTTFRLSRARWTERVAKMVARLPLGMHLSNAEALAAKEAVEDGLLVWPPEVKYVVGAEVKVSRFGPTPADQNWRWRGTHANDAASVLGQLRRHRAEGVARSSFWHLGVTAPSPWLWTHLAVTSDAAETFPVLEVGAEGFGCFAEVIGAVTGRNEADAGSHMRIEEVEREPEENPSWMTMSWWDRFTAPLRALPPPRTPTTFIGICSVCSSWFHSPIPRDRCPGCDAPTTAM